MLTQMDGLISMVLRQTMVWMDKVTEGQVVLPDQMDLVGFIVVPTLPMEVEDSIPETSVQPVKMEFHPTQLLPMVPSDLEAVEVPLDPDTATAAVAAVATPVAVQETSMPQEEVAVPLTPEPTSPIPALSAAEMDRL